MTSVCHMCQRWMVQRKRGRRRITCSDACRQARRRFLQGKNSKRSIRIKKRIEARRGLPFEERSFGEQFHAPVLELGYKRWVYECLACGKPFVVERVPRGAPMRYFCSDACHQKTYYHWKRFEEAFAREHLYRTRIDPRVLKRLEHMKLSPLCPQCKKPFAPNTTLEGKRMRGRPRKYCSDACRKAAYERRWKTNYGRARVHRFHECVECGTKHDRTDTMGRRQKRFCSDPCRRHFEDRVKAIRKKMRAQGVTGFKWGATGQRLATLKAPKNKMRRSNCDSGNVFSTGGRLDEGR